MVDRQRQIRFFRTRIPLTQDNSGPLSTAGHDKAGVRAQAAASGTSRGIAADERVLLAGSVFQRLNASFESVSEREEF